MPKNLTDVATYTDPVSVPVDADSRNAASVETPFQALANRTYYLAGLIGGIAGTGEWVYDDAPRTRVRIFSPYMAHGYDQQGITTVGWLTTFRGLLTMKNRAALHLGINGHLPDGATVKQMRSLIQPGIGRTAQTTNPGDNGRMWQGFYRWTPDFSTPAAPGSGSLIGGIEDDGTTNVQVMSTGTITEAIAKSASYLFFYLESGSDAATNTDDVFAFELTYEDPGPRNF